MLVQLARAFIAFHFRLSMLVSPLRLFMQLLALPMVISRCADTIVMIFILQVKNWQLLNNILEVNASDFRILII